MENNEQTAFWKNPIILATLIASLATVIIAGSNLFQIFVMKGTLNLLQENQKNSKRPFLNLTLSSEYDGQQVIDFINAGRENEKWNCWYFVKNVSENPAYNLEYYHEITENENIDTPKNEEFSDRYSNIIIWSKANLNCGFDPLYRQQVIDIQKNESSFYRHLFVKYNDEFLNNYLYYAKWKLRSYKIGEHPFFIKLEERKIE